MEEQKQRGRPSKFNEAMRKKILDLASQGKTDVEIGELLGVSDRAIRNWKNLYQEFDSALNEAKGIADDLVEMSLFQRAIGWTRKVKRTTVQYGQKYEWDEEIVLPPDPDSAKYWLKNRRPEEWRDKQEVEHSNPDGKFAPLAIITMPSNGRDKPEAE